MSNYNTSDDFEKSMKRNAVVAGKAAKKLKNSAAAKTAAHAAMSLITNPIVIGIVIIGFFFIIIASVILNTHSGTFNLITHIQEASIENSDKDVGPEVMREEDGKYAKVAVAYLNDEYDVLTEYIKKQCRDNKVKYDESIIVDNTTVPALTASSTMTRDVGEKVAEWCMTIEKDNSYKYYSYSENKKCPVCYPTQAKKGWQSTGFVTAAYYHGGGVPGIECGMTGIGSFEQLTNDTLGSWKNRNGNSWTRITNTNKKALIDESKLKAGDILVIFEKGKCKHIAIYAGDIYGDGNTYVIDAVNKNAGIRKIAYEKTGWKGSKYIKYAYRYTGIGFKDSGGQEISKLAKSYSWAETTTDKSAYKKSKQAYSEVESKYTLSGSSDHGRSGDSLVGIAIRESGYDTSFPVGNYSKALNYMKKHTEKWVKVSKNSGGPAEGDIIVLKDKKDLAVYCGNGVIAKAERRKYYPYREKVGDKAIKKYESFRACGQPDEIPEDYSIAAGSREVSNILSAFSIWDAQLIPIQGKVTEYGPGITEEDEYLPDDGTPTGNNASKILNMCDQLCYPKGTAKSKWDYKTGSPTKAYIKAFNKYNSRYSKTRANYSDCGMFVSTVVRAAGVDPSFTGLAWNHDYKKDKRWDVVHKGPLNGFKPQPGDIIMYKKTKYKKTNGNQHIVIQYSSNLVAEAGREHRFNIIRKAPAYNSKRAIKSTITVLRAKDPKGSKVTSKAEDSSSSENRDMSNVTDTVVEKGVRDILSKSTFKAIMKNTANRRYGGNYTVPSLFDISYGDIVEKDGKKYYSMIEINPASSKTLCKEVFFMDPNAKFTTEAPTQLAGTRNRGKEEEIGNISIKEAIQTQTDEHLALLYGNINGLMGEFSRLVLPIKGLFTDIHLSKTFAKDGEGIECTFSGTEKVYTCERGTVTDVVKDDPVLGNYIVIEGTYRIIYANMKTVKAQKGEIIDKNKVIGTAEKKFRLEVIDEGTYVDPEPLLKLDYSDLEGSSAGIINGRRTAYPKSNNKYFFNTKYNPFCGTWGPPTVYHNCTWYAYGRFSEILGKKANLPTGNAGTWYGSCHNYKKGKTPKLGAVACWSYGNGGPGHVAIVEEIKPNGDIVVSQSKYMGGVNPMDKSTRYTDFTTVLRKSNGYRMGYNGDIFQGFIYQP